MHEGNVVAMTCAAEASGDVVAGSWQASRTNGTILWLGSQAP